ncbi:FAD-dependent monooxygenase [Piscinibacter terrae]|uniref:FAD-dependent monooxygenase n=1 Tax=Piscinibacter terrae TaxID=2496871 RepID=A0A3N7J2U9_9BURK|nr:FAD-dependent monooxygenase [Albitalea terrae]RQP25262.1 FAD-dependent monooxygenase [Albitalea terrae]
MHPTLSNSPHRKALIAGGGIAGAVCAIALHKAGIEAEIHEAFDRGADGVGAYLTLGVNGIDALRVVGIDALSLGGFDTPRMALHLSDGSLLAEFDNGPRRTDGIVARTIKRSDLYQALRDEALRRGIAVHYGRRLADARPEPGGVVARFTDGSQARGDLLIGADGLHSRLRGIIDPKAPQPSYVGLLNVGGYARGVPVDVQPGTMHMYFGKRCFFGMILDPQGEVWWFANPAWPKEPRRGELAAMGDEAWRERLLAMVADDDTPAARIIRGSQQMFSPWATHDMPHVPVWHRDRMVLIGDAAHATSPSSGQGASMAIEDAVTLARCLRDEPSIDSAFVRYDGLRRDRVERVVAQGRKNGSGKAPGPLGRWMRDGILRLVFAHNDGSVPKTMRWIYDHHISWERSAV